MLSIFRPAPPLGNQLRTMVHFAGCETPIQLWGAWPLVLNDVIEPNGLKSIAFAQLPRDRADGGRVDAFKKDVISGVRPKLDTRVMKFFRGELDAGKLEMGSFADARAVAKVGEEAMSAGVISSTAGAYMIASAHEMLALGDDQGEVMSRAQSPGMVLGALEAFCVTGLVTFSETVAYYMDFGTFESAKFPLMFVLGATGAYYLAHKIPEIVKRR